jgi:hypothetical protein
MRRLMHTCILGNVCLTSLTLIKLVRTLPVDFRKSQWRLAGISQSVPEKAFCTEGVII